MTSSLLIKYIFCVKVDEENFGQTVSIELRPGGKETRVTNENKVEHVMNTQCTKQLHFRTNTFSW